MTETNAARAAALVRGAFGPELERNITAALDEAEARGRRAATEPMGFGTSSDAYYNLEGVIIDLEHQKADKICIKTLKRVQSQIAALLTPSPAAQPEGER